MYCSEVFEVKESEIFSMFLVVLVPGTKLIDNTISGIFDQVDDTKLVGKAIIGKHSPYSVRGISGPIGKVKYYPHFLLLIWIKDAQWCILRKTILFFKSQRNRLKMGKKE
jgi:hypothetical protein